MSGVIAIQQSQLWLNGGKQRVHNAPVEIAANQGQSVVSFRSTARTLKLQIPNPKFQAKLQFPNLKRPSCFLIEIWDLEFPWSLGFGDWDFRDSV